MYTTAKELIQLKIKKNFCIINLLELEDKIAKIEMRMKYRLLQFNAIYTTQLKNINKIQAMQIAEYKLSREHELQRLILILNSSNIEIEELDTMVKELKKKCDILIGELHNYNSTIQLLGLINNRVYTRV